MPEALSYKELEKLVKDLTDDKRELENRLEIIENTYSSKEKLYNQIFNQTFEGVIVIQGEIIKFINKTVLGMLGATREKIEKIKFSELIHPDNRGEIIKNISEIVSGEKTKIETEGQIIALNSAIIPVKLVLNKLTLVNNQLSILVKIENIQEVKSKEQEISNLRKSIEFVDRYLDEGLFLLKRPREEEVSLFDMQVVDVNTAGCKLSAKTSEEIVNKKLGEIFEISEDIKFSGNDYSSVDEDYEIHIKNLHKYFRISVYPLSDKQLALKFVDITDFFLTKADLNKNLQRTELLSEILIIFNSDKDYIHKLSEVLDRIAYHFKTRRILLFHNSERNRTAILEHQHSVKNVPLLPDRFTLNLNKVPSWNKLLLERKMILGFSPDYLPEDLREFISDLKLNSAYIFPIFIEDKLYGSILFENQNDATWDTTEINYFKMLAVLVSNLTSRNDYELKLLHAKEKAEEADRLKSSFLANMSHDIRIPMTAIIGFSDLLADPDLTIGEREEFIELISNSGQDLLTLVDNIVDVAKIETGQLRIQKDRYQVYQTLKEIFGKHQKNYKLINQDDLELILDLPEKYKSLPFDSDVFRFKQIMNNLIDNAIKFTDKGVIHFGISNIWTNTIEFYVHDTGIGIAEDTQDIIFERFSKIDRSYTKEYNGTGLGLAISKSLVELMGGEIRVVSYPGKGSTFYFTHPLPEDANELIDKEMAPVKHEKYNWENKTILIAEDVEQNFKFLEYIIIPTNAKVIWVKNGREALNYVKENNPCDCILMDIRMPVLNGIDATKQILKIRDIPIIAQTAYSLGDEQDLALEAGCVDYISKPVHGDVLLKTVQKHFDK